MSVRFVLDTDQLSLLQRGDPHVTVQVGAAEALAVTIVSFEEQVQGRLAVLRRASADRGYARLSTAW